MNRARDQVGAVGIAMLLMLGVLLVVGVLLVDTGRLQFEQRALQGQADEIALEAARDVGLCGDAEPQAAVTAAVERRDIGDSLALATGLGGRVESDAEGVNHFHVDPAGVESLLVELEREVPRSLIAGPMFPEPVTLSAHAVAERPPQATFALGSGLTSVDTGRAALLDALLSALITEPVSLSAVSYEGLANVDVTLRDLLEIAGDLAALGVVSTELDVGTPDDLLDATVVAGDLARLTAEALARNGPAAAATINDAIVGADLPDDPVRLGDVLAVAAGGSDAAAGLALDGFELVMASLLLSNTDNTLALDLDALDLGGGIDGLLAPDVALSLEVIEAPQLAVGEPARAGSGTPGAQARSAQVGLQLTVDAGLDLDLVLVAVDDLDLGVEVEAAPAQAEFVSARCAPLSGHGREADIEVRPGLAELRVGSGADPAEPVNLGVTLLGAPLLGVELGTAAVVSETESLGMEFEADDLPRSQVVATSLPGAAEGIVNLDVEVNVLGTGLPVDAVLDPLLGGIIEPLLIAIASEVLEPLLALLGIRTGEAHVELKDFTDGHYELLQ